MTWTKVANVGAVKTGRKCCSTATKESVTSMGRLPCHGATWGVVDQPKLPKPGEEAAYFCVGGRSKGPPKNAKLELRSERERELHFETLQCLESGAYRSAIVNAWNLTYERLRHWIFRAKKTRLVRFNAIAGRSGKPVNQYSDFANLGGEKCVVNMAHETGLINKDTYQVLTNALVNRNHCAHPSGRKID